LNSWHYVSCKNKVQEIRGYENYVSFKEMHDGTTDLMIVNAVFKVLEINSLMPLTITREGFLDEVERSILNIGLKDPFVVHNIVGVPKNYKQGLFVKTGNNRYFVCKKLGIKVVPCIVINITGGCGKDEFIEGLDLKSEEDVKKLFYTKEVRVVWRDGKIINAYTPKFLKISSLYR